MKRCIVCGKESDMDYCIHCGGKVEDVPRTEDAIPENEQSKETLDLLKKVTGDNKFKIELNKTTINKSKEFILSMCSFGASLIFLIMGFYKMWAYYGGDYGDPVNAYVGGDAYNYIINGTYATAFFVLTGALLISGILLLMLDEIKKRNK